MLQFHFSKAATFGLSRLSHDHADGLAAAAAADTSLYRWTQAPQGVDEVARYIDAALQLSEAGKAAPFATVRVADGAVIGSTRFFDLERWAWPAGHERHGRENADVGEIGYTWLTAAAIRTAANTEAKLLMLTHAFEVWGMLRICLHTDERNERSRAAIERIGAKVRRNICAGTGWQRILFRGIRRGTRLWQRSGWGLKRD